MLSSLTLGSVIRIGIDSGKDACWINFERNLLLSVVYVALRPIKTNLNRKMLSKAYVLYVYTYKNIIINVTFYKEEYHFVLDILVVCHIPLS